MFWFAGLSIGPTHSNPIEVKSDRPQGQRTVSSTAELTAALASMALGGTIKLAPGNYGHFRIGKFNPSATVTLRALNPNRPPVFTSLRIKRASRLRFEKIRFRGPLLPGQAHHVPIIDVRQAQHIAFRNCEFQGSADGNHENDPYGLWVTSSDNIEVFRSSFHDLTRGAIFVGVRNLRIFGSRFFDIRSDGVNFNGVQNAVIRHNDFTRFHPSAKYRDHPDFIQFWLRGAAIETRNIEISRNVMLQGGSNPVQAIFIENKAKGLKYGKFKNLTISHNVVYTSHIHGITLYDVDGAVVRANTLLRFPAGKMAPRINLNRVRSATIERNVTHGIGGLTPEGAVASDNVIIEERNARSPKYRSQMFLDPDAAAKASVASLAPRPGGLLHGSGAPGALRLADLPAGTVPILVETHAGTHRALEVSVEAWREGQGKLATELFWDFGDGSGRHTAGDRTRHRYARPGKFRIVMRGGNDKRGLLGVAHVSIGPPEVLRFVNTGRKWALSVDGEAVPKEIVNKRSTKVVSLGRHPSFSGMSELAVEVAFERPRDHSRIRQGLVWNHVRYGIAYRDGRVLYFLYTTSGQSVLLRSPSINSKTGERHTARLIYDARIGVAEAHLDGKIVDRRTGLKGDIPPPSHWGLLIGGDVSGGTFSGKIPFVTITTDARGLR